MAIILSSDIAEGDVTNLNETSAGVESCQIRHDFFLELMMFGMGGEVTTGYLSSESHKRHKNNHKMCNGLKMLEYIQKFYFLSHCSITAHSCDSQDDSQNISMCF